MQQQPARLWFTVLLLGWSFDLLFFNHTPGISFAIYAVLTLAGGMVILWLDGIRPAKSTWLLLTLIAFFLSMTFLRSEPLTAFLAHMLSLFLMAAAAVTYRGGQWLRYSLADYFARGADLIGSLVARPVSFMIGLRRAESEGETKPKRTALVWPVLRGLALAVPVVTFFAALLASADLMFAQRLNELSLFFSLEKLPEYIFRFSYILVIAYAIAGVYLHAAQRSSDEKLLGLEKPLVPAFFGFTESSIVLGSVVVLFGAFVIIQFQYFFGGQTNINLSGYTYADYARKGFGELVTVAFFALLLFLGLTTITKRETNTHRKIFSGLGLALLALVGIMLVSAYQRLVLYESAYGFTRLRTYTHVFMIWIAVLLTAVVVLELLQRQRSFALAALLASLGFAISLSLLNVDVFIFNRNLDRFEQGQTLDIGHLASLSTDVIPTIVETYETPGLNADTRDKLGAVLACYVFRDNRDPDSSWQSFHFSRYQSALVLDRVSESLKGYEVDTSNWPSTVSTPLSKKYDCQSVDMMD